ncbi:MAG: hypothetical protein QOD32_697 [Pyrinomonadaceae bacterium]|jgi:VWFA-related protein|nr:hypothetical protein [Pyrinomonadaceae bacterium]
MRYFAQTTAIVLSATLLLLLASHALNPGAHAQTPTPTQPQQPQPSPTQTPSPTETPTATQTPPPQTPTQTLTPAAVSADAGDDDEVEQVETNLVNVLFNAVDKNRRFITTLRQEDVRIYENNEAQTVATFERETSLPLSLAILIDVSESQDVTLPGEKKAARDFMESILRQRDDNAAVLSFTGTATVEQDFTADKASLQGAVERVEIVLGAGKDAIQEWEQAEKAEVVPAHLEEIGLPGSTAIWDAIWATANELMPQTSSRARRAIILLSDGDDTSSRLRKEAAVEAAIQNNTVIYSIGFESFCDQCRFDKNALRKVSEPTGGRAFFPEDEAELNAAFAQIQQELRTQYLISYSPTNKARDNTFRQIRIDLLNPELRKQKLKLTYRNGYFARPPAPPRARAEGTTKARLPRPKRPPKKR